MTWNYTFMHHDQYGPAHPCQGTNCSAKRAMYRLVAENGKDVAARNMCCNCSAKSAHRLGLSFPPINSQQAMNKK